MLPPFRMAEELVGEGEPPHRLAARRPSPGDSKSRPLVSATRTLEEGGKSADGEVTPRRKPFAGFSVQAVQAMTCVGIWWGTSVVVTLLMKGTVGSGGLPGIFPHPFLLTAISNMTTAVLAMVLSHLLPSSAVLPRMRRSETMKVLLIGSIQGCELALNNKSLTYLCVSTRTMAASTSTIFMMLTAWLSGLEPIGVRRLAIALVLALGGALQGLDSSGARQAGGERPADYLFGISLQVSAMLAASVRWVLVQFVVQRAPSGTALGEMSKLQLVARIAPVTSIVCLLWGCVFEEEAFEASGELGLPLLYNCIGIALGVTALTVAELQLCKLTSAVAVQVLGTLHQIPLVCAGMVFFHDRVSSISVCGWVLCLLGALYYGALRRAEIQAAARSGCAGYDAQPALPEAQDQLMQPMTWLQAQTHMQTRLLGSQRTSGP